MCVCVCVCVCVRARACVVFLLSIQRCLHLFKLTSKPASPVPEGVHFAIAIHMVYVCTAWCSEIGSLTSLDACNLGIPGNPVMSENQFHCTNLY